MTKINLFSGRQKLLNSVTGYQKLIQLQGNTI